MSEELESDFEDGLDDDWDWTCGEVDPCLGCSQPCDCGDCSICLTAEDEAMNAIDMGYAAPQTIPETTPAKADEATG